MISAALLAAALVLVDGQVLEGTAIVHAEGNYRLSLASGETLTVPEALVKEIRLGGEEPERPAPTAIVPAPAETLAGDPRATPLPAPEEQRAALGPEARFRPAPLDPTWTPTNAYDPRADVLRGSRSRWPSSILDASWFPSSAFDATVDVLAGSRSKWAVAPIDPTWRPEDGFRKEPEVEPIPAERLFTPPSLEPLPEAVRAFAPSACARRLFATARGEGTEASEGIPSVGAVSRESAAILAAIPFPLFRAEAKIGGAAVRAVFAVEEDACRLVGGDWPRIFGDGVPPEMGILRIGASYAAASADVSRPLEDDAEKMRYALALVALQDPDVSGSRQADLRIVRSTEELDALEAERPSLCPASPSERRREARAASAAFRPPSVVRQASGDLLTFFTWTSAEGEVARVTAYLPRGAPPVLRSETVARHVGAHDHRPPRLAHPAPPVALAPTRTP